MEDIKEKFMDAIVDGRLDIREVMEALMEDKDEEDIRDIITENGWLEECGIYSSDNDNEEY